MKFIKKHGIIIIIVLIIILLIIGLILYLNARPKLKNIGNNYYYSENIVELPGTVTYKNDSLSSEHCLNNICISDVTFHYNNEVGKVDYKITNNSNKIVSGYLKMVFQNQSLLIVYKDLVPKRTINSSSQYMGIEIKDKSDYKLEKLSKEEIKKIIK